METESVGNFHPFPPIPVPSLLLLPPEPEPAENDSVGNKDTDSTFPGVGEYTKLHQPGVGVDVSVPNASFSAVQ